MSANKFGKTSVINIEAAQKDGVNYLKDVYFTSPFKIMKPFIKADGSLSTILLTASAGIMEGDTQEISIKVCQGSALEFTSQSYEKIHKMKNGEAIRKTEIIVEEEAHMNYSPLPAIPFADSAFRNETNIYLNDFTSKFIMTEILASGRVAAGESFKYKYYISRTNIRLQGKLIYHDNSVFNPKLFDINSTGMFEGFTHLANLILCNYGIKDTKIGEIRNYLDAHPDICAGVSSFYEDGIIIKILGNQSQKLLDICNYISLKFMQ